MWFLYLDESGDLGFDFVTKKPSRFFTIAVLVIKGQANNRALINAVKHTIKRKLWKKLSGAYELKGSKSSIEIKQYFYDRIAQIDFKIYALTLNKKRVYKELLSNKERIYNYIARLVIDQIDLNDADPRVMLILDKSKSGYEIGEFNSYLLRQISGKLDPKVPLDIVHKISHQMLGLQAVDLFAWGIFRKYERKDNEWFDMFKTKIAYDKMYLP